MTTLGDHERERIDEIAWRIYVLKATIRLALSKSWFGYLFARVFYPWLFK